ncbi:MAG: hypothetical protein ACOCVF_02725 [bacterium]
MDAILHFLGLCADSPAHIDLLDILFYGGFSIFYPFFLYIKSLFTKDYKDEKIDTEN